LQDYNFTRDSYLSMMREAVPGYDRFEEATVAATGTDASSILELGTGTGETARGVLAKHPDAHLTSIDASPGMVRVARDNLPSDRADVILGRLEDPLPAGPFDLVVSALAVHHLEGEDKADLFRRIAAVLSPGGHFVLADVVEPVDPSYVVTHIDPEVDHPSTLDENMAWLEAAGLVPKVSYIDRDLVVIDARALPPA
jgi:tRNA (cmo5U34)-methyltransferase